MRRTGSLPAALALGALVCGCAWVPPVLTWGPPHVGEPGRKAVNPAVESEYEAVVRRYSARAEVYSKLDTRAFLAATFQTLPFREARVRREAAFLEEPPAWVDKHLSDERALADASYEFLLGAHVNDYRFDDFDKASSVWRIALVTSAGETAPCSVERVGRANLSLRALYPYLDDFWTVYRVRFPKVAAGGGDAIPAVDGSVRVVIASSLGATDLIFPAR